MLYSKKLILLFSIVFTTISITAQTLSKDVISSGGDYVSNNSYSISSTIGESVVETFNNSGYFLTQGFQQPSLANPPCAAPAPYHQEFTNGALPIGYCVPNQWATSVTTGDGWRFVGTPGYAAANNGRTSGTYAWIDFSSTDVGTILEVEDVETSTLTTPTLEFDYFSDNGTYSLSSANTLYVEAYDGSSWIVIDSLQVLVSGWNTYQYSLNGYLNGTVAEIRFRGESSGLSSDYYNDLLLDDVKIDNYSVVVVSGCMDSLALNYNSNATVDDSSCVYPPSNDDCVNAIAIACGSSATGDNTNASSNATFGGPAIWYSVVGNGGDITVETCLSSFDTRLFVYDSCNASTYSHYNDDFCGLQSSITFTSTAGSTYYIAAAGYSASSTGLITVSVACATPPVYGCTDPTALNYDSTATIDDGSCIAIVYGCTDSLATNYYPGANMDDGSCTYTVSCSSPSITGLGVSNVIHDRVTLTFDDMNSSSCRVDQLRIKYREVGTSAWSQKNMGSPTGYDPVTGICNSTSRTDKLLLGLSSNTTYEWQMRVWYCSTGNTPWVNGPNFTTLADCPNVGNLAVTTPNSTKATFTWDNSNGAYSFVRLQARVDTLGSSFFNIGGVGVQYGTYTKNKNGLVPGTTYRAKSRTWCDPNGGAYKAPSWTSFIFFTMPGSVRLEESSVVNDLDIYPNPSRDVFNISFKTINKQDITLRIRNIVGEEIYTEELNQFDGTYTKAISLENYSKAVYFLEINTTEGTINKKLILQ